MRSSLALLALCCACSPQTAILLEVDADALLIGELTRAKVDVLKDSDLVVAGESFDLTGELPSCLPFSETIVPGSDNANAELQICVELMLSTGGARKKCRRTEFREGVRSLVIEFEEACLRTDCSRDETTRELPEIDLEEAEQRISQTGCKRGPEEVSPADCVARDGCYFEEETNRSCRACPEPTSLMEPAPPEPPVLPEHPRLVCRPGWTRVEDAEGDGPAFCQPWSPGEVSSCPLGQARFPSASACVDLLDSCPPGQYAENYPAGRPVIQVAAGDSVAAAIAGAPDSAVILLAKGTHLGANLSLDRPLALIGACARETSLPTELSVTSTAVELAGISARNLRVSGALQLSGVELRGAANAALQVSATGAVRARALSIVDSGGPGIEVLGGTLTATSVSVTGATGAAAKGTRGARLELEDAALLATDAAADTFGYGLDGRDQTTHLRLSASIIEAPTGFGIQLISASASIEDSIIRNISPIADRSLGDGVRLAGGHAVLERVLIEHAKRAGLYVNDGGSARMTDLIVRDIEVDQRGGSNGQALLSSSGGRLEGTRIFLERATRRAINMDADGVFTDLTVRDTSPGTREEGYAMYLGGGASVTVMRAELVNSPGGSIQFHDAPGTKLHIEDLTIPPAPDQANGISLRPGTELILRRARIEGALGTAIAGTTSERAHSSFDLEDLTIIDTRSGTNADGGYGVLIGNMHQDLDAHQPVTLRLQRAYLENNATAGIGLARVDEARLEDITVIGTRPGGATKEFGAGIGVAAAAVVRGTRIVLRDNTEVGLFVGLIGAGNSRFPSIAELSHVIIEGTSCTKDQARCSFFHGAGAGTAQTGQLRLSQFRIRGNEATGAGQYYSGSELDLIDGEISMNPTGVSISEPDYDLARVIRGVVYRDNLADIYVP